MTETEELTPRQACEKRIQKLEDIAWDIERGLSRLQEEIETLRDQYPPLREVMEIEVGGVPWYTDGHRAVRGAWPGEYTPCPNKPDLGALLKEWREVHTPVTLDCVKHRLEGVAEAVLSDGTAINADWMREMVNGRGYTMHHDPGLGPVIFRDAAGDPAACAMPIRGGRPNE